MKKFRFLLLAAALVITSVIVLSGCNKDKPTVESASLNQAGAPAATVKGGELINITPDAAIDIALENAGVARENAVFAGTPEIDEDNGVAHYDVEFRHEGFEYDYEIAISNGAILKSKKEAEKNLPPASSPAPSENSVPESTQPHNGYISIEEAKSIALSHAKIEAANATFKKAYYDSDDLVPHYDIKFVSGGYEYDYEIKAADGSVLEKDVERDDNSSPSAADPGYITADEAKTAAYTHARIDASEVKRSKAELDRDDGIVHYDVEFVAGNYEYEYEINAKTGNVIAHEKDLND